MAQTKKTKKFEKNHLSDILKRRKEGAKIKQRHKLNDKRKEKRAKEAAEAEANQEDVTKKAPTKKEAKQDFENMNVDEFFQGGFDIPKVPKKVNDRNRKRKRDQAPAKADPAEDSDDSVERMPVQASDDEGSDSEDDVEAHKKQLDALAEKDPEFHKYLQENDPDLLNLEDADLGEIDELSASDDDDTEAGPKTKKQKREAKEAGNQVTKALLKKWETAMIEQHSLRATREVVLAFRSAAHVSDEEDQKFKYSISNPEAYHELLVIALKRVPEVLQHHLPVKESYAGKVRVPTETKKYRNLTPLLKSHLASLNHLLTNLSDAATLSLTLQSLTPLLPYVLSFKRLVRDLSKTVVNIWSEPSNTESARIAAFLVLRRLVVIGDPSIREAVLRATYQGLVKGSRNTTVHTISGVNLMKNSAAELWGLDYSIGYTTGYQFIRQLAIHLRSSITNNSNESYKTVYNWQYVHSLDFWSRVLSAHCDTLVEAQKGGPSPLRPLIYPVVQVTLGALRLIPTAAYFPLRFHLIRALLRISLSTSTYIPLGAAIYEVLNSSELRKAPKNSTLKPLDFATSVRAPKSYLRTRVYQDGVGEQVVELLSEYFMLWTKSIAFPELSLPVIVLLKRWLKDVGPRSKAPNQNSKLSGQVSLLVQKLDANCKWIEERRAKVEFAPNERAGVEGFLKDVETEKTPLGAFVKGQRKGREARAKMLEESRREDEKNKKEEREEGREVVGRGDFESDDEEVNDESESEDEEVEIDEE
ncbi:hypothetical protein MBLNU457_2087t1 [Dothideomycetes sp. NU457]